MTLIAEILEAMHPLLQLDEDVPLKGTEMVAYKFEEKGGTDLLESLQHLQNDQIYTLIQSLIDNHLGQAEEME